MCQAHLGRDSPPPEFAKIRCQEVGKSEMVKTLVLGLYRVLYRELIKYDIGYYIGY